MWFWRAAQPFKIDKGQLLALKLTLGTKPHRNSSFNTENLIDYYHLVMEFCFAIFRMLAERCNHVKIVYLFSDETFIVAFTTHDLLDLHWVEHVKPPDDLVGVCKVLRQIITYPLLALNHRSSIFKYIPSMLHRMSEYLNHQFWIIPTIHTHHRIHKPCKPFTILCIPKSYHLNELQHQVSYLIQKLPSYDKNHVFISIELLLSIIGLGEWFFHLFFRRCFVVD